MAGGTRGDGMEVLEIVFYSKPLHSVLGFLVPSSGYRDERWERCCSLIFTERIKLINHV